MYELDPVISLAVDSHETKLGLAFFPIADAGGFAIAGQDSNRTANSNSFIRQLYRAKPHRMGCKIVQNLRLGEDTPVRPHEHVVIGIDFRELLKIILLEGAIKLFPMHPAHFLYCQVQSPISFLKLS
jgi:hypothetical protein